MTTLLLALAIAQPQTITFSHPCAHSSVVLEALGKEVGLQLRPSGSVSKDYFLVSFKDVSVADALKRIADTLNAAWIEEDGVHYLGRSLAQEREDFESEYSAKAAAIRAVFKERTPRQLDTKSSEVLASRVRDFGEVRTPESWAKYQVISREMPGYRALARIVSLLDLDELVRTPPRTVSFYSGRPESPLPSGATQIIDDLSKEWALYAEASGRVGVAESDTYQKFSGALSDLRENLRLSVQLGEDAVIFSLRFLRDRTWQNLAFETIQFDRTGKVPAWVKELEGDCKWTLPAHESVKPTALSEQRPAFREALLKGSAADAMLAAPSESLVQAAGQLGASIVAYLPDDAYKSLAATSSAELGPLAIAVSTLFERNAVTAEMSDGWLVVRPSSPYTARLERVDRSSLLRLARYAEARDSITLDVFADFVGTTTSDRTVEVASHAIGRAFVLTTGVPILSLDSIRIYGLMNPTERAQAKAGVYTLERPSGLARFAIPLLRTSTSPLANDPPELAKRRPLQERTDALAALPTNVEWSVSVRPKELVQPFNGTAKAGEHMVPMEANTFAANRALSARRGAAETYDFKLVSPVNGWTVNLHTSLLDRSGGGVRFVVFVDPMAPMTFGPFEALSEALRQAIAQAERTLPPSFGGG